MKKLWEFMSGKKSNSALTTLLLVYGAKFLGVPEELVESTAITLVESSGALLGALGLLHKWLKARGIG